MENELISVIIPVYNISSYLERCVDSVIGQTYTNLEILLVDDGSTDESGMICDRYAHLDERIRVFHKKNGGLSSSRNYGLARATGKWISLIDGDDWVSDSFISDLHEAAVANDAQISYCKWFFANGNKLTECSCFSPDKNPIQTVSNLIMDGYHVVWNKLYLKAFLDQHQLCFPEHIQQYNEDSWFSIRAFFYATSVVKLNQPLYNYNRANPSAITKAYRTVEARSVRNQAYQEILDFFKSKQVLQDYEKPVYWRILQEKTWMVFFPEYYAGFNDSFPEANQYLFSNPLLSWKMKIMLWLIIHKQGWLAKKMIRFINQ